jgi:Tfp pilus assembly protein PilZ
MSPALEHIIEPLLVVSHISKLFIDGKRHWVTPDYAMTRWRNGIQIRLRGTEDEAECARSPDVRELGKPGFVFRSAVCILI